MEIKELSKYTDRELLEITVTNQAKIERNLHKIYWFLAEKYKDEFTNNNIHLDEAMKNILESHDELDRQIKDTKSSD